MSALTLKVAVNLAGQALAAGRAIASAPLTIAVLDGGGHLITLQRDDGRQPAAPADRHWQGLGCDCPGQRLTLARAGCAATPGVYRRSEQLGAGQRGAAPGGVLIRDQEGLVLGAIGISGDTSDIDEQCAITAIEALGLWADAGVSA